MRRTAAILACAGVWTALAVAAAVPAAGHACTVPARVQPGRPATVTVGVAAEEHAVVEVSMRVPAAFRLERVAAAPGWVPDLAGDVAVFRGGRIAPFSCGFFTVVGVAPRRATIVIPLRVRTAEGRVVVYDGLSPGDPYAAQVIYAGTSPPGGTRRWPARTVGAALVVLGAAGSAAWWVRGRRAPGTAG